MKIIQSYATQNGAYKNGQKGSKNCLYGAILHSVGVPQPSAEVFVKNHNKPGNSVMPHAWLQDDGKCYQTLPWEYRGWHVGGGSKGSGNDYFIGVETTEPNTIKYTSGARFNDLNPTATKTFVDRIYKQSVELFAWLCRRFEWNPQAKTPLGTPVVMSHAEAYRYGYGSGHDDPMHLWGKFGYDMDMFRADVASAMKGETTMPNFEVELSECQANYKELENYVLKLQAERNELREENKNLEENLLKVQEERTELRKENEFLKQQGTDIDRIQNLTDIINNAKAILNKA